MLLHFAIDTRMRSTIIFIWGIQNSYANEALNRGAGRCTLKVGVQVKTLVLSNTPIKYISSEWYWKGKKMRFFFKWEKKKHSLS